MKILQVNKFNFVRGGADKYFLDLSERLAGLGHEVRKFCMQHPHNLPDPDSANWPSQVSFHQVKPWQVWRWLKIASRVLWSFESARLFERMIIDFQPNVIHLHNIYHQLSPSILPVAKKYKIPVVMHLHDYKLVCPNYQMFDRAGICERCQGNKFYHCALRRCFKNSLSQSLLATVEMYLHHSILKVYEKNIDQYIAPSEFMRQKMIAWGVAGAKIKTIPHFIDIAEFTPDFNPGNYLVYFGRLSKEKGIDKLLQALTLTKSQLPLKIIGAGAEIKNLQNLIVDLKLTARVELIGPKSAADLQKIVASSLAVVVPSQWHEVFGLVNLEAAALGKPVIAARSGGIPETVKENETALLFAPDNINELAAKIDELAFNKEEAERLGRAGWEFVKENFKTREHLEAIITEYEKLMVNSE